MRRGRAARRARRARTPAREPVAGATAYVSLEPCSHHGRQPPCADALIEAGIGARRVRDRRPQPRGRRPGLGAAAGGGDRGRSRRRPPRGRARRQNAGFRTARRARPPVRAAQARRDAGRPHGDEDGGEPLDLLAREPRARARLAGRLRRRGRRQRHGAGRRSRAPAARLPRRRPSGCRCGSCSTAAGGWRPASKLAQGTATAPVLRIAPPGVPPPPTGVEAVEASSLAEALHAAGCPRGHLAAARGRRRARGRPAGGGARRRARALHRAEADRRRRQARCSARSASMRWPGPPSCSRRASGRSAPTSSSRACCSPCPDAPWCAVGVSARVVAPSRPRPRIRCRRVHRHRRGARHRRRRRGRRRRPAPPHRRRPLLAPLARSATRSRLGVLPDGRRDRRRRLDVRAVPETLRRTTLAGLAAGARVNLEDALRAGEPLRRPHRAGPRRRRRRARRAPRGGHRPVAALPRARARPALSDREGRVAVAGRQPDDRRAARRRLRGRDRPAHARR